MPYVLYSAFGFDTDFNGCVVMAGRYPSKDVCDCGNPTMPKRNVCYSCFRKANTEAARKHRLRVKIMSKIAKDVPDIKYDDCESEINVYPKQHYYRIQY